MATIQSYTKAGIDTYLAALMYMTFNRQTDSYTLVLTDARKCIEIDAAGAKDLTVPTNANVAFPIGTVIDLVQRGAGAVTIVPGDSVTLRSLAGNLKTNGQYSRVRLHKVATNEWYVSGDLTA